MNSNITVIIPLYNKEKEIGRTLESVLGQSVAPAEIIVVDDGSTDNGPMIVSSFGSPMIRLITQGNAGVSSARNRGIAEARTEYVALLDGDDTWETGFLEKISGLIERYPGCGVYAAGFSIVRKGRKYLAKSPEKEGIVDDFFCRALDHYICSSSSVVISKSAAEVVGGFPAGMKIGEDLHMWIRLASSFTVCFTPEPLVNYMVKASNRAVKTYSPENTRHSFEELYRPGEGGSCRNEYIARCAINKAITLSAKGDTTFGKRSAKFFSYTKLFRLALYRLRTLNAMPRKLRPLANNFYAKLAWLVARKGF